MPLMTKRKADGPKRIRKGYNLNVWINPALGNVIDAYLATTRPRSDKTAVVEMALEEMFKAKGLWPPPQPEGGA
jgi:hypothetical protein